MKRQQPFFDGTKFYNHPGEQAPAFLFSSIKMYLHQWLTSHPEHLSELHAWHEKEKLQYLRAHHDSDLEITWIGHATFLIKHLHATILTDPVFESLTFLFPRLIAPGIMRHELPTIDAVYISHNHRDHLEKSTIEFLTQRSGCMFYVPRGDDYWLTKWNVPTHRIVTSTWWDQHQIPTQHASSEQHRAHATFLPAQHWSQRSWNDTNRSLWGSWMFKFGDHTIYFAGDTAYGAHFTEIAAAFPQISCALMPIGPCEPSAFLKKSHIGAEEAGHAFQELGAQAFIPMHWGTYGFGIETPLLPLHRITAWWKHNNLTQQLIPLRSGASHHVQACTHQAITALSPQATL